MKGRKATEETRQKMREASSRGEKSRFWKGGGHRAKASKEWRDIIFKRDNWTCQQCNLKGVFLEAHHIKSWAHYPELRFDIANGITLCKECHKLTDNYKGKGSRCAKL